jgi:hypothetical protein
MIALLGLSAKCVQFASLQNWTHRLPLFDLNKQIVGFPIAQGAGHLKPRCDGRGPYGLLPAAFLRRAALAIRWAGFLDDVGVAPLRVG